MHTSLTRRQAITLPIAALARQFATPTASTPVADPVGTQLQAVVATVDFGSNPGALLVALIEPDGSVAHASTGGDWSGIAPTPDDLFRIGSITKVFTSLLALGLVDEGLVALDDRATQHVTRVPVSDAVIVRDLLQHTSGIPSYTEVPGFHEVLADDAGRVWTPEELVGLIEGDPAGSVPGSAWAYSNTNYIILGVLIEEVTGQAYAEVLRERLLDPLGLEATYLAWYEDGPPPFDAYFTPDPESGATPSPVDFDYTAWATAAWATGGLVSTGPDLHRLARAVVSGRVISEELFAEMTDPGSYGYGLGLEVIADPVQAFGHGGGIPGYATFFLHAPSYGRTLFFALTGDQVETQGDPTIT